MKRGKRQERGDGKKKKGGGGEYIKLRNKTSYLENPKLNDKDKKYNCTELTRKSN